MKMRLVRWMLPELGLLRLVVVLFRMSFYLLVLVTWPIHGPIRWWWRTRRSAAERGRASERFARKEARQESIWAAEQAIERENDERRAAGEYVPHISDNGIKDICHSVAYIYGAAYRLEQDGISPLVLQRALDSAEAKFGWTISEIFGVNPRSMLRAGHRDFVMCLALSAFLTASEDLTVIEDGDGTLLMSGTVGSQGLGVFAQAANTTPGFAFAKQHSFFDQYYVARSFIPDHDCSENEYEFSCMRKKAFENGKWETTEPPPRVSGVFGPDLTWLTRIFRYGPV